MNSETLKFEFEFESVFWDKPPAVKINLDNAECFQGLITAPVFTLYFFQDLELDSPHRLQIIRYNKDDSQCQVVNGEPKDQMLILRRVLIDGIDLQNVVLSRSWYEPTYSESYSEDRELETHVPGETWWGHNGIWNLEFRSPVWQWLIEDIWNG